MSKKLNLAVFISGSGSNLQSIIDACEAKDYPAKVKLVVSNNPEAYGLVRAKNANIPSVIINHKSFKTRQDFESAITKELKKQPIDLICLAGFMRILTADFISQWPDQIINTHPSLLPKFGGEGMFGDNVHKAVIAAGETQSGASIHYVIPEVDKGRLIAQISVPVLENDTYETLGERVRAEEHELYVNAIKKIAVERT